MFYGRFRCYLSEASLPLTGIRVLRHSAAKRPRDAGESFERVSAFLDHSLLAGQDARICESANTSARLKRKARQQREQGLPPTNRKRCFGYDRTYAQVVESEAAILREARDRVFAGESLNSIAFDLEARGVVGTMGNAWRPHILKRLLTSPTIAGARLQDGQLVKGQWRAIISVEDSRRLGSLLNRNNGRKRERSPRTYLLTGLLRCGRCSGRLSAQARKGGVPTYVCRRNPGYPNCGRLSAKGRPIEELVREMVIAAVDGDALAAAMRESNDTDLSLVEAVRADEVALEELTARRSLCSEGNKPAVSSTRRAMHKTFRRR